MLLLRALLIPTFGGSALPASAPDADCGVTLSRALSGSCLDAAVRAIAVGPVPGSDSYVPGNELCSALRPLASDAVRYMAVGTPIAPLSKPMVLAPGFGDTGTTSLSAYLTKLGFKVGHGKTEEVIHALRTRNFARLGSQYDALSDDPIGAVWAILLMVFPHSRVILTTRSDYHRGYSSKVNYTDLHGKRANEGNKPKCETRRKALASEHPHETRDGYSVLGSCMMYGTPCATDKTVTKALQDAHAQSIRLSHPCHRTLVVNISAGELNFERIASFMNSSAPAEYMR